MVCRSTGKRGAGTGSVKGPQGDAAKNPWDSGFDGSLIGSRIGDHIDVAQNPIRHWVAHPLTCMRAAARTRLGWAAVIFPGLIASAISVMVSGSVGRASQDIVLASIDIDNHSRMILIASGSTVHPDCVIGVDFRLINLSLGDRIIYSIGSTVISGRGARLPSPSRPLAIPIPAGIPPGHYNLIGRGISDCATLVSLSLSFEVHAGS